MPPGHRIVNTYAMTDAVIMPITTIPQVLKGLHIFLLILSSLREKAPYGAVLIRTVGRLPSC